MVLEECISKVAEKEDLSEEEALQAITEIMQGKASPVQISAFLTALKVKGEGIDEIVGAVRAMRQACIKVPRKEGEILLDICGTGGDKIKTFNVSTIAAFIVAACGVKVAKHGNRSITGKCGSADVLEALGVNINVGPQEAAELLQSAGVAFMFAPLYHPAMKEVMPVRRELKIKTIFNIVGPLSNPANATNQLVGVYSDALVKKIARVLRQLGLRKALVVHGVEGLDEVSILEKTNAAIMEEGKIALASIAPEDFGVEPAELQDIQAMPSVEENALLVLNILSGKAQENKTNFCLINAAAALVAAERHEKFLDAMEECKEAIASETALRKLREFVVKSAGDCEKLKKMEEKAE